MTRAIVAVAAWAAWLAAWAVVLAAWTPDDLPRVLLGAAAGGAILIAGLALWRPRPDDARAIPDDSVATVVCAVGAALMLLGVAAGLWLTLIGAGVAVLGLAGVARELAAQRREAGR